MASHPDIRWKQRFQSFGLAFARLSAAAHLAATRPLTDLEQQGLIQAFEFTHELAWNVLKDYLEAQGISGIIGSKNACREAFKNGLLVEGQIWMDMIQARNRSSHTYNESTAREIASAILADFVPQFHALQVKFAELISREP
ncbi:MAG: nucleotidyltransferase substrate binding protein [Verrucomicrobia bacterium]|nr:nucleotidyltransferase substrate binding protein [Verrucomicrobiota bacterium]